MRLYKNIECFFSRLNLLILIQEVVPAHLATSPIPTESHMFWLGDDSEPTRVLDDPLDLEEPPEPPLASTGTAKKKKRRRKKHKGEPRREEPTPPASSSNSNNTSANNEEIFEMDLSSDEEAASSTRWIVALWFSYFCSHVRWV